MLIRYFKSARPMRAMARAREKRMRYIGDARRAARARPASPSDIIHHAASTAAAIMPIRR